MGTCISSRNSIRVSDMSGSVTKDDVSRSMSENQPRNQVKPIEVLMEHGDNKSYPSKYPPCNSMSDESSGSQDKNEDVGQESQHDFSATYDSLISNLNENTEIDSIVKMRLEEFISESSDSDSSSGSVEDSNMLWIPFSMAQHMGVTTVTRSLDTRDRIYANDEELFMSVETSRRNSHLTHLSLSSKAVKSRPGHSFVTNLTHTNIAQNNVNNNHFPTDDSSELIDAEIQKFDDNWISIIDR